MSCDRGADPTQHLGLYLEIKQGLYLEIKQLKADLEQAHNELKQIRACKFCEACERAYHE